MFTLVLWYSYRWLLERYHYLLKSGCRLEQLQLESADSEALLRSADHIHRDESYLHDCHLVLAVDYLLDTLPASRGS